MVKIKITDEIFATIERNIEFRGYRIYRFCRTNDDSYCKIERSDGSRVCTSPRYCYSETAQTAELLVLFEIVLKELKIPLDIIP